MLYKQTGCLLYLSLFHLQLRQNMRQQRVFSSPQIFAVNLRNATRRVKTKHPIYWPHWLFLGCIFSRGRLLRDIVAMCWVSVQTRFISLSRGNPPARYFSWLGNCEWSKTACLHGRTRSRWNRALSLRWTDSNPEDTLYEKICSQ